jgi:thioredoxin 2
MANPQLIRCPRCGVTNRVPLDRVNGAQAPVCGRCKAALPASSGPVIVTDASFAAQIERSPLPVLLDMWAPWCGPCRTLAPVIEDLANELAGRVLVAKLNVDENPLTSERFQVRGIPALLVLKGGREVDRMVGAQPKAEILRRVERAAV